MSTDRPERTAPAELFGSERILARLRASERPFTIHRHAISRSFAEGVERLPFPPEFLLKTVAFEVAEGGWTLVTLHGGDRVDFRALADALGAKRSQLRQASPDDISRTFGVEIGGVSPIPTIDDVRLLFDRRASEMEIVYAGTGLARETLEIRAVDLLRITGATIADVARAPAEETPRTDAGGPISEARGV